MKDYVLTSENERFHTPRLAVVQVSFEAKDGSRINHTIIRSKPSVAVIPVNDFNEIAFIEQFRSTTGDWYYELPAGLLEDGEGLLEAASREVAEETGLIVKDLEQVSFGPNLLDPSKSDEDYGVVVARVVGRTNRNLDEQEAIEENILWMPHEEAYERLKCQIKYGTPFYDNLFMSGHSMYALLAYKFALE